MLKPLLKKKQKQVKKLSRKLLELHKLLLTKKDLKKQQQKNMPLLTRVVFFF